MAKAEFPGNSNRERIEHIEKLKTPDPVEEGKTEEPAELEKPALEGKVVFRNRKLGPRLKSMFVTDGMDFADHLFENVVVPMAKDIVLSIIVQIGDNTKRGFEQMLFPNGSSTNDVRTSYRSGPIPYNSIHRSSTSPAQRSSAVPEYQRRSSRHSNRIQDVVFEYRSDAQKALTYIQSQIEELGHCTVGDYYGYVEPDLIQSTDENWGWTNIDRARVVENPPGEFRLILPEPHPIHGR